jgi:hypothetical protein
VARINEEIEWRLVAEAECGAPAANITSLPMAVWWAISTVQRREIWRLSCSDA